MDIQHVSVLAGTISTSIFTASHIPMLVRAFRTKDLRSYSVTNLLLSNLGNAFHWLYIANLPFGPIWFLHTFYTVVTAMMLFWYMRYRRRWSPLSPRPLRFRLVDWRISLMHSARNAMPNLTIFCMNRRGER